MAIDVSEGRDWLRLVGAAGLGPHTVRRLLNLHGDVSAVIAAAESGTLAAEDPEFDPRTRLLLEEAICASCPEDEQSRLSLMGGQLLPMSDTDYPAALLATPDPPPLLRVAGEVECLRGTCVAIVGTRRCSCVGLQQADRFASSLASAGITVVSGGARGIDIAAHRAAMRAGGATAVVLGSGLCHPYPPEHGRVFDEVRSLGGVLLSELPVGQPPRPGQFPRRNRIISGLSAGTLVIEAPRKSGAMLTARMAVESHGRECWAVASDAGRREGIGGMEAVRDGWAGCVVEPADVLADVMPAMTRSDSAGSKKEPARKSSVDVGQRCVLDSLKRGAKEVSILIEDAEVSPSGVMGALTSLELLGAIRREGSMVLLTPAGIAIANAQRRGGT